MRPSTPILLIIWRRTDTLSRLIQSLRPLSPSSLFIASDGPRRSHLEDADQVAAARSLVEREIDWPCSIKTLYSSTNHGCRDGPVRALNWFFDHVDEGIILEEDCIPHPDFLYYCATILDKYRDDTRVWCVCGNNFQSNQWRGDGSYYFSKIPLIWGWATWRRCWKAYDASLSNWPQFRESNLLDGSFADPLARSYWASKWELSHRDYEVDWWDYQWVYTCVANGGLCVHPNINLVNNIGTGPEATHTTGNIIPTPLSQDRLDQINHPSFVLADPAADQYLFDNVFGGHRLRRQKTIGCRIYHRFHRLIASCKKALGRMAFHAP